MVDVSFDSVVLAHFAEISGFQIEIETVFYELKTKLKLYTNKYKCTPCLNVVVNGHCSFTPKGEPACGSANLGAVGEAASVQSNQKNDQYAGSQSDERQQRLFFGVTY